MHGFIVLPCRLGMQGQGRLRRHLAAWPAGTLASVVVLLLLPTLTGGLHGDEAMGSAGTGYPLAPKSSVSSHAASTLGATEIPLVSGQGPLGGPLSDCRPADSLSNGCRSTRGDASILFPVPYAGQGDLTSHPSPSPSFPWHGARLYDADLSDRSVVLFNGVGPSGPIGDARAHVSPFTSLQVSAPAANRTVTDVGLSIRLNVTITGGAGPYNRTWFGLPSGCASANTSSLVCRPGTPGAYSVSVRVRDTAGTIAWSNSTPIQVNAKPTAAGIGPASGSLNAGTVPWNTTLIASWTGGTSPFALAWNFGDGTVNGSGNPVTHEYTMTGTFTASVAVTDSLGVTAPRAYESIESRLPLAVQLGVSPNTTQVGSLVNLTVHATDGFPPYSYSWSGLPSSCAPANAAALSCSTQTPGTYVVSVRVSDQFAENVTKSSSFVVRSLGSSGPPTEWGWISIAAGGVAAAVAAVAAAILVVRKSRRNQTRPRQRPPPRSPEPPSSS